MKLESPRTEVGKSAQYLFESLTDIKNFEKLKKIDQKLKFSENRLPEKSLPSLRSGPYTHIPCFHHLQSPHACLHVPIPKLLQKQKIKSQNRLLNN